MADELVRRAVQVLTQLRTLSEVPARAYDRERSTDTAEDALPVRFTASGDLAPVEPSEFLFHRGRINGSATRLDFEVAVLAAEEALRSARKTLGVSVERSAPQQTRNRVGELANAGLSVAEIAYKEDLPVRWVSRVIAWNLYETES